MIRTQHPPSIKSLAVADDSTLTYHIFGQPLHTAPVIVINHSLTSNSEVAGPLGWWRTLIGDQQTIDLQQFTVLAFNIPGNGHDSSDDRPLFKKSTTRNVAQLYWQGIDALNIPHLHAVIGCSLGGGIAWEMSLLRPQKITYLIPIATTILASDWLIGHSLIQDNLLTKSTTPLVSARMHAMTLYRNPDSFSRKFKRRYRQSEQQYEVERWLKYHGNKIAKHHTVNTYRNMNYLLRTIGEDLTKAALITYAHTSSTKVHCIAIDSDYMFTKTEQFQHYQFLKAHDLAISYHEINSPHGHDAFLIEYDQLNNILTPILSQH